MLTTLALTLILHAAPATPVGEWRYTSTRATTYWSGDGVYAGHGGGMSDHLVFRKDGTFTEHVYIATSMGRGWTSEAFNTIEGRYEVEGDRMKLIALSGRQHGEDTLLAVGRYDRPMPADVLARQNKTYRFQVRQENGKCVFAFLMGANSDQEMKYTAVERPGGSGSR